MNVIVSNKQKNILDNANIDAIKDLNGLFKVEDLINNLRNYFFTKMVVDATSIVEFANPTVLKKLTDGIGAEKLVILLPSKPEPPKKFIELLISLGIYNFSSNINDIVKFLQQPNTYDDVKSYLEEKVSNNKGLTTEDDVDNFDGIDHINNFNDYIDENANEGYINDDLNANINNFNDGYIDNNLNSFDNDYNDFDNNYVTDDVDNFIGGYVNNNNINNNHINNENMFSRPYNNNEIISNNINNYLGNEQDEEIENATINLVDNSYQENHDFGIGFNNNENTQLNNINNKYILGVRNMTSHAGTTTLIYMLKNILEYRFNKKVLAIEIKTNDFFYFKSKDMISVSEDSVEKNIKNSDCEIILIDLNNNNFDSLCSDIICLIEPSIISVNRLILENRMAFVALKNKKVILNKCLISNDDVNKFSQEAGIPFYFVIPPLNDRVENSVIEVLVNRLGIKH